MHLATSNSNGNVNRTIWVERLVTRNVKQRYNFLMIFLTRAESQNLHNEPTRKILFHCITTQSDWDYWLKVNFVKFQLKQFLFQPIVNKLQKFVSDWLIKQKMSRIFKITLFIVQARVKVSFFTIKKLTPKHLIPQKFFDYENFESNRQKSSIWH